MSFVSDYQGPVGVYATYVTFQPHVPLLLEAAEAEGASILCIAGSRVHLSGVAERLQDYQFVNPPEQPLQELGAPEREAVYAKLVAVVERVMSRR